jgi:hypothetical protein
MLIEQGRDVVEFNPRIWEVRMPDSGVSVSMLILYLLILVYLSRLRSRFSFLFRLFLSRHK